MPQCVRCKEFFPPNYTEVIHGSQPDQQGNYPQECIFCKLNIDEVERETQHNSGQYTPYTKKQCIEDYKKFLRKLKDSGKAKDIINNTDSSGGIRI